MKPEMREMRCECAEPTPNRHFFEGRWYCDQCDPRVGVRAMEDMLMGPPSEITMPSSGARWP
jgi:hypothetical protein